MRQRMPISFPIRAVIYPKFLFSKWLLLFLLVATGCDMKMNEPVMPTWSVDLNVPIGSEVFKLAEITNDSTIIAQGADSALYLSIDGSLESFEISAADFSTGAIDTTHTFEMGSLKLNNLEALKTGQIALGSFFPELANMVSGGQTVPFTISDTTFFPAPSRLNAGDFVGFRVSEGVVQVTFTNNLPFPVGPNANQPDGFQIVVVDSLGNAVMDVLINERVESGQTLQRTAPMGGAGGWVYAPLRLQFVLPIAEQTTFQLNSQVLNASGVEMDVKFNQLVVDEAIARMDPQEIVERAGFSMDDQAQLREAVIERGHIRLDFLNQTAFNMMVNYSLPNILDAMGEPISGVLDLDANGSDAINISLAGAQLADPNDPNALIDSVLIDYRVLTDATANIIHVRSSDLVSIGVQIEPIEFQSLAGVLDEQVFEISPYEETDLADYSDVPNNIRLDFVDFGLQISNEYYIERMALDLTIVGYHEENGVVTDSARLELLDQRIEAGLPGSPGVTYLSIPGEDAADFLNILPTRIRTYGRVVGAGEVEIHQESDISGAYSFSTPLRFRIEGDAYYESDVETLDNIDQDIKDASDENFHSGDLKLTVTNATPLGGSIRVFVSADSRHADIYDTTHYNPNLEFRKEIALAPAQINSNTGYVQQPALSELFLTLTREEMRIFKNDQVRVGFRLQLDGTDSVVALRSTDFISIAGLAQFKVTIKD